MHRRRLAFLVSFLTFTALLTTSCNLATAPVPADLEAAPSSVPFATTDGVHFLEPIQQAVDADGFFDPTAPLTIEFFRVQDGSAVGGPLGPTLSTVDGTVRVSVDDETGAYLGVWALRDSAIQPGDFVRAEIRTSNAAAGAAACDGGVDLDGTGCLAYFTAAVYRDARQANRATAPEGMLRVVANQTLPIRLFVAEGAANLAPAVEILAPDDGAVFPTAATVALSAAALDPEEGDLSSAIEWRSDVDGPLGTGPSISVPLSDDTHTITASVRDRYGRSGSATISIAVGIEELAVVTDAGGAFAVFTNGSLVSLAPGFVPAGTPVKVTSAPVAENVFREGIEAVGDQITVSIPSSVLTGTSIAARSTTLRPADFTLNQDCDTTNDCLFVSLSIDRTLAEAEIIGEVTFQVVRDVAGAAKEYLGSQTLIFPAILTTGDAAQYGLRLSRSFSDRMRQAIDELDRISPDVRNEFEIVFVPAAIRTKDQTASGVVEGLYRIDDTFSPSDLDAACSQPAQHQIPTAVTEVIGASTVDPRRPLVLVHGWTQIQDFIELIGYGFDQTSNLELIRDLVRNNPLRNPYYPFAMSSEWLRPPLAPKLLPQICAWNEFLKAYFGPDGEALRDTYELYSFGYDSRQSIGSNAEEFADAVELAFSGREAPAVVAHSTGGLLTHAAMLNGANVGRLITLGSPYLGAQSVTCSSIGAVPSSEPSEYYASADDGTATRCTNATLNPQVMDVLPEAMSESLGAPLDAFLGLSDEIVALLAGPVLNRIQHSALNDAGTQDLTWFETVEYEVTELVGHTCAKSPLTSSTGGCGPVYTTQTRSTGPANPFTQNLLGQSKTNPTHLERIVAFVGDRVPTRKSLDPDDFGERLLTVFYDAIATVFEFLPASVDSDGFITTDSAGFQPGGGRPEIPAANRRLREGFTHSQLAGVENFAEIREVLLGALGVVVEVRPGERVVVDLRLQLPDPTSGELGADVMFLFDRSGSFGDDLSTFRTQATNIVNALADSMDDLRVGLSSFVDAPCSSYGSSGDFGYALNLALTDDVSAFGSTLSTLNIRSGSDGPESQLEAMQQAMTGEGFDAIAELPAGSACGVSSVSISPTSPGWSASRVKFLLVSTDAPFHDGNEAGYPYPATAETVIDTATASGTRVIFLNSGSIDSRAVQIANATGGAVYNLGSNSAGVVEAVRTAAGAAIRSATVRLIPSGDDQGFVESITPTEYAGVDLTTVREVPFTVTFTAAITQTAEPQYFRFDLVLSVDGAEVERVPVRVVVPGAR